MKKRIISVILTVSLIVSSVFSLSLFAFAQSKVDGTDIPTVYVGGQGQTIYDKDGNVIYPIDLSMDEVMAFAENNAETYLNAVLTQDFDEFFDELYNFLYPVLSTIALDENGDRTDGSYNEWSWSRDRLNGNKVDGVYPINRYNFHYDWRLDPLENAVLLRQYIEDVLYVTGENKVELIGRCLGANVAEAYLYLYDGEYIDTYLQYASASQGSFMISKLISGKMGLYPDAIEHFFIDNDFGLGDDVKTIIDSIVTILNKTYGLDLICNIFNYSYEDIYMDIIPRLIGATYGTFPGYWSMVMDCDYEEAKEVSLYSRGYDADSKMVKRLDDFHYNVMMNKEQLFSEMKEKGVNICNITKYGYAPYFFLRDVEQLNDDTCFVTASSEGATTSTTTGILPIPYIVRAMIEENDKYISPDFKIDASTCLNPDSTWFIKNLKHADFPNVVNDLMVNILNNNDCTVDSFENYPQFLVYDGEKLNVMDSENQNTDSRYKTTFFGACISLVKAMFNLIINSK